MLEFLFLPLTMAVLAAASPLNLRRHSHCTNGPETRNCWGTYRIEDDPHQTWPNTGVTRKYTLVIEEKILAPDGFERPMMVVNGQYPGPTIEGNWGDWMEITVVNKLTTNGTGIHWHGVRQYLSNPADGTISQTECPIAPGDSHTYRWQATQHGTGWYHSHYSLQYSDGVLGPIVINGPRTANYDIDMGPILLTDWYHERAFDIAARPLVAAVSLPPIQPTGLINGMNTYHNGGKRFSTTFTPGKRHLLRLINTGSEVTFKFSIDDHKLQVVAMDWTPLTPYTTDSVNLAVGQRLDVIVEANQKPTNYWMRAVPQLTCLSINLSAFDIRGIVRYDSSSTDTPQTLVNTIVDTCTDEPADNLVPFHHHTVGTSSLKENFNSNLIPATSESLALRWEVGADPYKPGKAYPVAQAAIDSGVSALSLPNEYAALDVSDVPADDWVYLVVQSQLPVAHPIHLHGHDTYLLGRGGGLYLKGVSKLNLDNPPRRDTIQLPALGWLVVAFKTDNPGAWIFHCHIAFHLHHGFARSIVERKDEIKGIYGSSGYAEMDRVCKNWKASGLENNE